MITAATELALSVKPAGVGWIAYIIIGGLAGWLASKFMGTDEQQGFFLNIVVGIIGAMIGGYLLTLFGGSFFEGAGWFTTFITAIIGACILLGIVKAVRK